MRNKIALMYYAQCSNSKRRGMAKPSYSKDDLIEWLENDFVFSILYNNWMSSFNEREMSPSLDRIDDSKPYTFNNVVLMTWGENKAKNDFMRKSGTAKACLVGVNKYKGTTLLDTYYSVSEAARQTGLNQSNISKCCSGKRKSVGGYRWEYSG